MWNKAISCREKGGGGKREGKGSGDARYGWAAATLAMEGPRPATQAGRSLFGYNS
jgi:hypothetical protein